MELLREAQQKNTLVGTQKCLLADEVNRPPRFQATSDWAIPNSILKYKGCIHVPNGTSVHAEILCKNHDDFYAGHSGSHKTLELLQCKYCYLKLAKDVWKYVFNCETCNCTKVVRHKPYRLLQSLPMLEHPWQDIIIDFIVSMPLSLGMDNVLGPDNIRRCQPTGPNPAQVTKQLRGSDKFYAG